MSEKPELNDAFRHYRSKDDFVRKDALPCTIMTLAGKIEGYLHKRDAFRMIDELNAAKAFIPVTDAKVQLDKPKDVVETEFMILRSDQIIWVNPLAPD